MQLSIYFILHFVLFSFQSNRSNLYPCILLLNTTGRVYFPPSSLMPRTIFLFLTTLVFFIYSSSNSSFFTYLLLYVHLIIVLSCIWPTLLVRNFSPTVEEFTEFFPIPVTGLMTSSVHMYIRNIDRTYPVAHSFILL
jgi:hypothetical protein